MQDFDDSLEALHNTAQWNRNKLHHLSSNVAINSQKVPQLKPEIVQQFTTKSTKVRSDMIHYIRIQNKEFFLRRLRRPERGFKAEMFKSVGLSLHGNTKSQRRYLQLDAASVTRQLYLPYLNHGGPNSKRLPKSHTILVSFLSKFIPKEIKSRPKSRTNRLIWSHWHAATSPSSFGGRCKVETNDLRTSCLDRNESQILFLKGFEKRFSVDLPGRLCDQIRRKFDISAKLLKYLAIL